MGSRGRKATYRCAWCCVAFTARVADRARGWARYCSKSCKAKAQTEARDREEFDPLADSPMSLQCNDGGGWEDENPWLTR